MFFVFFFFKGKQRLLVLVVRLYFVLLLKKCRELSLGSTRWFCLVVIWAKIQKHCSYLIYFFIFCSALLCCLSISLFSKKEV